MSKQLQRLVGRQGLEPRTSRLATLWSAFDYRRPFNQIQPCHTARSPLKLHMAPIGAPFDPGGVPGGGGKSGTRSVDTGDPFSAFYGLLEKVLRFWQHNQTLAVARPAG